MQSIETDATTKNYLCVSGRLHAVQHQLLHGRRSRTAEYMHAHADVANIGVPRFQLLSLSIHMERCYQ